MAETALALYPEECNALLTTSLLDHLTRIARDVFKESETDPATDAPLLPGFPAQFYAILPRAVAVPRAHGRTMVYKAIFGAHQATTDELQAGIDALTTQIGRDTARRDALVELLKYRLYHGDIA